MYGTRNVGMYRIVGTGTFSDDEIAGHKILFFFLSESSCEISLVAPEICNMSVEQLQIIFLSVQLKKNLFLIVRFL
jgi:hypothetical protein